MSRVSTGSVQTQLCIHTCQLQYGIKRGLSTEIRVQKENIETILETRKVQTCTPCNGQIQITETTVTMCCEDAGCETGMGKLIDLLQNGQLITYSIQVSMATLRLPLVQYHVILRRVMSNSPWQPDRVIRQCESVLWERLTARRKLLGCVHAVITEYKLFKIHVTSTLTCRVRSHTMV